MKRAVGVLALLVLSACGRETYDERTEHFAMTLCNFQVKCSRGGTSTGYDSCHQDILHDMAKARNNLDQVGLQDCMKCMQVKIDELNKYLATCSPPSSDAQVTAACGAHGDDACAGYP